MKTFFTTSAFILGAIMAPSANAAPPSFEFASIDGGVISSDDWQGHPVLVVNTASLCGFTPQYDALQTLFDTYGPKGLVVLAVPSDDFNQELADGAAVKEFCEVNFNLTLPMTEITHVKGADAHPFYQWLLSTEGFQPKWNFNKVLLGPDGEVLETWGSMPAPDSIRHHWGNQSGAEGMTALSGPLFIGSEIYRGSSYGPRHPLRVPRVSTVMDLGRVLGWLPAAQYRSSPRARVAALTIWHSADYIDALQQAETMAQSGIPASPEMQADYHLGTLANPIFAEMFRRPATGAGGTMLAAELLREGGVVHVPGGGTHHGLPGRANGFCYLNDVVLGMLALRNAGVQRICYVDLDAHHCDGVQHAFAGDPDALLISIHEAHRWPFTGLLEDEGGGNCFNLPVPRGFNDTEMRAVVDRLIWPRVSAFRPEALVLQCGADALDEDPLSRLSLSNNAYFDTVASLRDLAPRLMVLGGGGYNPWSVGRAWAGIWATLAGYEIPDVLPEPAVDVLQALTWGGGGRPAPSPHLLTTLRDTPREGAVRPELRESLATLARR